MAKVKITQIRGLIRRSPKQVSTIEALGLRKIGHSVEKELNASVEGMLKVVSHMVKVEEV